VGELASTSPAVAADRPRKPLDGFRLKWPRILGPGEADGRRRGGANATLTIDLPAQEIRGPDGGVVGFEIDAFRKQRLIEGLDDIMDVGFACAYLATPFARRVTGGLVYVDGGANLIA
jgi:hypothetical protein